MSEPPCRAAASTGADAAAAPAAAAVAQAAGPAEAVVLELLRQLRFGDGLVCVHCGGTRVLRWGRARGRQRYRCGECRRTFSDLTGTVVAYTKRLERWSANLERMAEPRTVRAAAHELGVSPSTAMRWRHQAIHALDPDTGARCGGVVALLPLGQPGRPDQHLFVVGDDAGRALAVRAAPRLTRVQLARVLKLCVEPGSHVSIAGTLHAVAARAAHAAGLAYVLPARAGHDDSVSYTRAAGLRRALRSWFRRFRGVETRHLDAYLAWHAELLAAGEQVDPGDAWLRCAGESLMMPAAERE